LPSETMIWQPEFTDKILSRKPGAVQFEFQDDDRLSYQAVSSIAVGEKNGWFQLNLQIPYRAL
ncbi:hypothetical protein AB2894_25020, partial [Escherichia coli]